MKKLIGCGIIGLFALGLLIQLIPYGRAHKNPPVVSEPKWDSPATRALAQRACFDCHSNKTVWPWYSNVAPVSWLVYGDVTEGRGRLNFSDWAQPKGQYVDELQAVLVENSMPPGNYLLLHPSARLSADEKKQLSAGLGIIAASYRH